VHCQSIRIVAFAAFCCAALLSTDGRAATLRMVIQSHPDAGGKCLDVPNRQFVPGMRLQTWDCNNTAGQTFSYDETSQQLTIDNLCVEDRGGGNPQDSVGLGNCNGGANQHWMMVASGDYYRIVGAKDLCVAIAAAGNGTALNVANCQNSQSQLWALVEAPAAVTNQAPPALYQTVVATANDVKQADKTYLTAKCDGAPTAQLTTARSSRDGLRDQLGTLVASDVSQLPEVQGALDAMTAAGVDAAKAAGDPTASDQAKAAAQAKFQIAKSYFNDAAKTARERTEAQLKADTGISLAAAEEDCPPDTNKSAAHKAPVTPKKVQASSSQPRTSQSAAPPPQSTAPPPGPGLPIGIGIGGIGIGGGGPGIMFGR
jgi:hypothetical protein